MRHGRRSPVRFGTVKSRLVNPSSVASSMARFCKRSRISFSIVSVSFDDRVWCLLGWGLHGGRVSNGILNPCSIVWRTQSSSVRRRHASWKSCSRPPTAGLRVLDPVPSRSRTVENSCCCCQSCYRCCGWSRCRSLKSVIHCCRCSYFQKVREHCRKCCCSVASCCCPC